MHTPYTFPNLDQQQNRAAQSDAKALLVLSGAGSGKTTTLIAMIHRQIMQGLDPNTLLILTFSRKACKEIVVRLRTILPEGVPLPRVETYHSYGYKLIQNYPAACRRRHGVSLLDEADQKKLFKETLKESGLAQKAQELHSLASLYDRLRNDGLDTHTPRHMSAVSEQVALIEPYHHRQTQIIDAFRAYETRKRNGNFLDYNDLQVLPVLGLKSTPQWLSEIRSQQAFLGVDESQDTNRVQYALVKLLAFENNDCNVVMVGDDDQAIYEWRGARPENLEKFISDFRPEIVKLEQNYRSTHAIVDYSAKLIAHNKKRLQKTPYSERPNQSESPVQYLEHVDTGLMAEAIAESIANDLKYDLSPSEIAVLYRTNRMATLLEGAFIRMGIPYHVTQGIEINNRPEAQLLFAHLRLAVNPSDHMALAKLAPLLEGVGEKGVSKLAQRQADPDQSSDLIELALSSAKGRALASYQRLHAVIQDIRNNDPRSFDATTWAMDPNQGNFGPFLESLAKKSIDPKKNAENRLMTLYAIGSAFRSRIPEYPGDLDQAQPAQVWEYLLQSMLSTPDEEDDTLSRPKVTLSTIHKAKGLEWDTVHIAGFSHGLMPMVQLGDAGVMDEGEFAEAPEEERRLAYVAMTRAKNSLFIHHASILDYGYTQQPVSESPFLGESGLLLAS